MLYTERHPHTRHPLCVPDGTRTLASPAAASRDSSPPAPASEPLSITAADGSESRWPAASAHTTAVHVARARRPRPVQPSPALARRPPSPNGSDSMIAFVRSTCQSRTTEGQPSAAAGLQRRARGRVSDRSPTPRSCSRRARERGPSASGEGGQDPMSARAPANPRYRRHGKGRVRSQWQRTSVRVEPIRAPRGCTWRAHRSARSSRIKPRSSSPPRRPAARGR